MTAGPQARGVYRAGDRVRNEEWVTRLEEAADRLELGTAARSRARDLFLSTATETDRPRSKRAAVAAAIYAATLLEGDRRSQAAVADAVGVSRLTVQQRWKDLVAAAGLDPPEW